ncbi:MULTISPECIES: AraC family transcriptional regulator [Kordiimonas]|jgi:AraC-like DNA-binding protein|uniref:AraC family transcriptional regulator n=1 Tax=Kordiimonas TaxID=288021 RepID=UPI00257F2635|nr:AraC family transcriptional regulator [Kordiimonas sp. UBA4487]
MPTVAAGLIRDLLNFAVGEGGDREALLKAVGLENAPLDDQDARLPATAFVGLIRAAVKQLNRPDLALQYGKASRFDDFSIVGLISFASNSVGEGFQQMNRYAKLVLDTGVGEGKQRFRLEEDGDCVWVIDQRPNPNMTPELTETVFARFVGDFSRFFGDALPYRAFHVTHDKPVHWKVYEEMFGVPVTFGAKWNALKAHKSWLELTTGPKNRYAFGVLSDHADALMRELEASETLRGQVEKAVLPMLHKGEVSMEKVAEMMGISRPTLYRRLKAEGLNFETLLDDLRRTMAISYLEGGKASVNEVAYLVGFSEASSFSRAFKRWTGKAPSEWRG